MIRVAFVSIVLALFSSTTQAAAPGDVQTLQQLALKFLATIDRGEIDQALAMYAPPPTQAGRRAALERSVTARKSRGALRNTRLKESNPLRDDGGYIFLVESDASVPVRLAGGETMTTLASIMVTRSEPSAPYRIQSFDTQY